MSQDPRHRLVSVTLDEASIGRAGTEQEHERAIAIYDLSSLIFSVYFLVYNPPSIKL